MIEASSGEEALKLLRKPNEIDLVVLDVMMPGLRGTEVLREMKKIAPDLGIIILTGYSTKEVAIEALKGHADDYIEKPLDIDKTKEIIDGILEGKETGGDIDAGGLEGKVEVVKRFVQRNYHKKVSLKDAAATVYLSPKYLSRIFKETTGGEFSDYKLRVKIEKAGELLRETGYNIDQISQRIGYENTESFTRIFKKLTGSTPTEYRKEGKIAKARKGSGGRKSKEGKKGKRGKSPRGKRK